MIENKWVYVLNSLAWALVGVVITLVYQRILAWWQERHNEEAIHLRGQAWVGSLIIIIAIASAALSGANQLAFSRLQNCENRVQSSNTQISNERAMRNQQDSDNLNKYLQAQVDALNNPGPNTISTIQKAHETYLDTQTTNNQYRATHLLTPPSVCK